MALAEPPGQTKQRDTEHDGVRADQEDHGQCACASRDQQDHAEHYR